MDTIRHEWSQGAGTEEWFRQVSTHFKLTTCTLNYNPAQTAESFLVLCPWQCWSWAFPLNKQTLSTKNVLHCQMSQCSKSYYRTWSSPCYANHLIFDADLQSCLQCIQQLKNTRREREEGRRTEAGRPRGGGGGGGGRVHHVYGKEEAKAGGQKNLSVRNKRSTTSSCRWLGGNTLRQTVLRLQKVIKDKTVGQITLLFKAWWRW